MGGEEVRTMPPVASFLDDEAVEARRTG